MVISPDNIEAIEFHHTYSSYIKELCSPLDRYFGIKFFAYAKIFYSDISYIFEGNNFDFLAEFLKTVPQSRVFGTKCLHRTPKYHVTLWPDQLNENDPATAIYSRHKIWNGISFTKTNPDSMEIWGFASDMENKNITPFYIKNLEILEKFIVFYESKTISFRSKNLKPKAKFISYDFSLPGLESSFDKNKSIEEFLSHITMDGYNLKSSNGFLHLTKREYECLNYLASGATVKSIAQKLGLSPRTIEAHVNNTKAKTGINYKVNLVDWFRESNKF